ncbi:MAG: MraY family glycosyltransferase [Pseudomonadota bacterium]
MAEKILFIPALGLTILVIPWIKKVSFNMGYVDHPGNDPLKVHVAPIPHSGGLAIFGVFALLIILVSLFGNSGGAGVEWWPLLLGGGLVFSLGMIDDLKNLHLIIRLSGEIAAGMLLIFFGRGFAAPLFLSLPLTLCYVVGAINAVNMADGLDGLAGGMVVLSLLGFALLANRTEQTEIQTIIFLLAGVGVGFLIYNFNPASIFMGDGGSYFLGFVLAYLAISFTGFQHWGKFIGPILIIGVPVLDTALAIFRRMGQGVSPFFGDRSHFYDLLIQRNLTVRQTVLIGWALQAIIVGFGVFIYQ